MSAEALISCIRVVHLGVFFFVSSCIVYVVYCGVSGSGSKWLLRTSIAIPTAVGVVWRLNGGECPLASLVYRLAGGDKTTSDILLPLWFSRWIMTGSTLVLAVGIVLVLWRGADRWGRSQAPR